MLTLYLLGLIWLMLFASLAVKTHFISLRRVSKLSLRLCYTAIRPFCDRAAATGGTFTQFHQVRKGSNATCRCNCTPSNFYQELFWDTLYFLYLSNRFHKIIGPRKKVKGWFHHKIANIFWNISFHILTSGPIWNIFRFPLNSKACTFLSQ